MGIPEVRAGSIGAFQFGNIGFFMCPTESQGYVSPGFLRAANAKMPSREKTLNPLNLNRNC
jgi:hypothetical protein